MMNYRIIPSTILAVKCFRVLPDSRKRDTRRHTTMRKTVNHHFICMKAIAASLSVITAFSVITTSMGAAFAADALPEKYDSRDYGYITPVKNQGSYGTCWAHGIIASCEASLIKNNGYPSDLDLSEFHLAYSARHKMYDRLGLYDTEIKNDFLQEYMTDGGNDGFASITLAGWNGLVEDNAHQGQFSSSKFDLNGLNQLDFASKDLLYCMNAAHVTDYYSVKSNDISKMKEYIMRYGAGTISLFSNKQFLDNQKGIWLYTEDSYVKSSGHMVSVVGWDDTIPAEELGVNGVYPHQDGAFIIKNSWGTGYGQDGYYYVPYEPFMLSSTSMFYALDKADNYTYNYGYDDTQSQMVYSDPQQSDSASAANVFTATSDDETLEAVSFFPENTSLRYNIKVYTDVPESPSFPEPGTLRAEVTGETQEKGYRTVRLPQSVGLRAGERFAIVVTLTSLDGKPALLAGNHISNESHSGVKRGESYFYTVQDGWLDVCDRKNISGNMRIKAFTNSPSAPALTEPDDYESCSGKSKEELTADLEAEWNRLHMIFRDSWNYNSDDAEKIFAYSNIYYSIQQNADQFTASEIFATGSNLKNLIDSVRTANPTQFLLKYNTIANKLSNRPYYESIPQYQDYMREYQEIVKMAERREIKDSNVDEVTERLGQSFLKLLRYLTDNGHGSSGLQRFGDINNDGVIDINDATQLQRIIAEYEKFDFFSNNNSDVNGDYNRDIQDVTCIQKLIAQLSDHLPVYDKDFYIKDEYTADSDREELTAYLRGALDERAEWKSFKPSIRGEYDELMKKAVYDAADTALEEADNLSPAVLLYYTRHLLYTIPANN